MTNKTEILAPDGSRWVVRECLECSGVVVEVFRCQHPAPQLYAAFDAAVAKVTGELTPHPEGEPDDEPAQLIDVPLAVLPDIIAALQSRWDAAVKECAEELQEAVESGGVTCHRCGQRVRIVEEVCVCGCRPKGANEN